jgi:thiamine pyrophosphate-dependent acetolactate synthase large subunit-like protein
LARPDRRIIVCNGDGSMLMNLGSLVTIAAAAPLNLTALVFDNGAYEVTGGQPVPGARSLDFAGLARSSGFTSVFGFARIDEWRRSVRAVLDAPGPTFVVLDVAPVSGAPGPRSPGPAGERARRFIAALADEGPKVSTG